MTTLETAEEKLIEDGNTEAARTLESFETRWKYAVFPAMIAFVVLAVFGFYLIYGMLQRMEDLSRDVNRMTKVIEQSMPQMQADVQQLSKTISVSMPNLEHQITGMSTDMRNMSYSTNSIASTTHNMGQNMWEINRNVSQPFSFLNKMIPGNKATAPAPSPYYVPQK